VNPDPGQGNGIQEGKGVEYYSSSLKNPIQEVIARILGDAAI